MDGSPILFETQTAPAEVARANVRSCLARGLPDLGSEDRLFVSPGRHGVIVANGPSALEAPFHRTGLIALNGALGLFVDRGLAPRYWVACDPQPMVADFVRCAPQETTYLVASKAAPEVFDALEGRDVRVWHCLEDETADLFVGRVGVPGGISVTLRALSLFRIFAGAQSFETYGWDASFGKDGTEHASTQAAVSSPRVTIDIGGEGRFLTTHQWAAEVDDAARQLEVEDYSVTVHGAGLMGAALRTLNIARASNRPDR